MRPITVIVAAALAAAVTLAGCRSAGSGPDAEPAPPAADATPVAEANAPGTAAPPPTQPPATPPPVTVVEPPEMATGPVPEEEEADPEALQAEALEACQSAAEFIDQGELEDAVAALDRAYELMLSLPRDGDNGFLQAREDIRRLVAELLVRTYESQQTAAAAPSTVWDLEIAVVENEHVQREIRSFTTLEREAFLEGYRRSGLYRPMILERLEAAGLPSQLSWMPLVESWFKVRALSRAGALGMWQFISSTGLRYGLERDAWIDERMDPDKATAAAIRYLTDLHGLFGDWPKALAAYNCGEARVQRAQNRNPGQYLDFWDLYEMLPGETRRYVPRFFASLMIIENPGAYGMQLPEPLAPVEWTTVSVDRPVELGRLDRELELEEGTLAGLNSELRHRATPDRAYELKVPVAAEPLLVAKLDQLPDWSPPTPMFVTHRVRRGDTLSGIAGRYGTSVSAIMRANNIRSAHRIWPGQRLQVPVRGDAAPRAAAASATGSHVVRRGDSLYSIARRYGTTVAQLKAANGLASEVIYPGQELRIRPGTRDGLQKYRVARGDTLSGIASTHRVRLSSLLRVNGLTSRSTIYPGQWLVIPDA